MAAGFDQLIDADNNGNPCVATFSQWRTTPPALQTRAPYLAPSGTASVSGGGDGLAGRIGADPRDRNHPLSVAQLTARHQPRPDGQPISVAGPASQAVGQTPSLVSPLMRTASQLAGQQQALAASRQSFVASRLPRASSQLTDVASSPSRDPTSETNPSTD